MGRNRLMSVQRGKACGNDLDQVNKFLHNHPSELALEFLTEPCTCTESYVATDRRPRIPKVQIMMVQISFLSTN